MLGLVGFIQQAQLSLDRLPSDDLSRLVHFYDQQSKHTPHDVLSRLAQVNQGTPCEKVDDPFCSGRATSGLTRLFRNAWDLLLLHRILIADTRLCLAEVALRHYVAILTDRTKWVQATVVDVRLEMAYVALLLERAIHPRAVRELTHRVYHLNHAESLKLMAVEDIAGSSWLVT